MDFRRPVRRPAGSGTYFDPRKLFRSDNLGMSLAGLLLVCNVITSAAIFDNVVPGITAIAVYFNSALLIAGILIGLFHLAGYQNRTLTTLFLLWVVVLLTEKVAFSYNSGYPLDASAVIECMNYVAFIALYTFRVSPHKLMRMLFWISVPYLLYYLFVSLNLATISVEEARESAGYLGSDGERDGRVFIAGPIAAFVLYYALTEAYARRSFVYATVAALATYDIYVAQSRVFTVVTIAGLAFLVMPKSLYKPVGLVAALLFLAVTGYFVAGVFTYSYNPFDIFMSDGSGWARAVEFDAAREAIQSNFFFGGGIARTGSDEHQEYMRSFVPFFASDIGAVGIWTFYGALGLAVYIYSSLFALLPGSALDIMGRHSRTLRACGLLVAIHGVVAPTIMFGGGRIVFSLLLFSAALANDYARARDPAERQAREAPGRSVRTAGVNHQREWSASPHIS